jgi:GDP-L-fucose synthase
MFKNQNVLVTGGAGMIGRQLVDLLLEKGAKVTIADLNKPTDLPEGVNYVKANLLYFDQCEKICKGMDYVFNLVGIKCSPKITMEQPADIMGPMMQFNTNMLEAAMKANIKWYLYTSTVGVYTPAEVFYEDDVWKGSPSPNDWYGGWAKRMGELQCEAYAKQLGEGKCSIVRPANVYGPYDNFDLKNAMVVPSLIRKAFENDVLEVWGDGSPIRDFIHAKDVARGMIFAVENKITKPLNLGSGTGVTIRDLAEAVANNFQKPIQWSPEKPSGDARRIFSMERANSYGFFPEIDIHQGVESTINWFILNQDKIDKKFNALNKQI